MRIGLRLPLAAALVAAGGLGLVACGSSAGTSSGASGAARSAGSPGRGTVSVLYAGSLVNMMEHDLGPAFSHADGFGFEGVGAGSTELVAQIKGKVRQGDVFISATPEANLSLEGSANGDWVSWYATFARAPLVLGYNPNSSFAGQFHGTDDDQRLACRAVRIESWRDGYNPLVAKRHTK